MTDTTGARRTNATTITDDELDALRADHARLRAVLGQILGEYWHAGHPGEPCHRINWVRDNTLAAWRQTLADSTERYGETPQRLANANHRQEQTP